MLPPLFTQMYKQEIVDLQAELAREKFQTQVKAVDFVPSVNARTHARTHAHARTHRHTDRHTHTHTHTHTTPHHTTPHHITHTSHKQNYIPAPISIDKHVRVTCACVCTYEPGFRHDVTAMLY